MMQHTPGPWHLDAGGVITAGLIVVAIAFNGCSCAVVRHHRGWYLGNARLITAAPELLKELIVIEQGWAKREGSSVYPLTLWEKERLGFMRSAIAKATSLQAR